VVGDLEHGGELAARRVADRVEDRFVVVEQQHGRTVGAHVVHGGDGLGCAGADETGRAAARSDATCTFCG
jgi:hypothetical protein